MTGKGPRARVDGLLTERVDGEVLVYDLDGDVAVHLNETAALVWRSCDGNRTVAEIAVLVAEELGEAPDDDVVLMALDNLAEHGLLSSGYDERDGAAVALSRRRFFRRVGIAGVKAPVVYSLIVPTAAAALSTGGGGGGGGGGSQFNNPSQFNTPPSSGSGWSDSSGSGSSGSGSGGGSGIGFGQRQLPLGAGASPVAGDTIRRRAR